MADRNALPFPAANKTYASDSSSAARAFFHIHGRVGVNIWA
jgi:hypothetical protein